MSQLTGKQMVDEFAGLEKRIAEKKKASENVQFCPLLKAPCLRTRCEWWLIDRCSIKALAYNLYIGVKMQ